MKRAEPAILVGLVMLVGVVTVLTVAIFFGTTGGGRQTLSNVGRSAPLQEPFGARTCAVSPPLNADEIGWTPPTDEEWAALGCQPRP